MKKTKAKINVKEEKNVAVRNNKAITLIALIVTIIVLLILAGVSIATLTGENGILTRANDAKIEQTHATIRESIELAYNEWQIVINTEFSGNKNEIENITKLASTNKVVIKGKEEKSLVGNTQSFLKFLEDKEYINTEGKIDVEKLTGNKQTLGNGTSNDIYKLEEREDSYILLYIDNNQKEHEIWAVNIDNNGIEINIKKMPEDENQKTAAVIINAEIKQNGSEIPIKKVTNEEYYNMLQDELNNMTNEEKEEIFVDMFNISYDMNCKDIDEVIEFLYTEEEIEDNTKDAFYETIGGKENFNNMLIEGINSLNYNLIGEYDFDTEELREYKIENPEGKNSKTYVATKNGNYTFTARIDGKQYTKTVSINNIEESEVSKYSVENIDTWTFGLKSNETGDFTTFSNAYIIYNDEVIDISEYINNERR